MVLSYLALTVNVRILGTYISTCIRNKNVLDCDMCPTRLACVLNAEYKRNIYLFTNFHKNTKFFKRDT